MCDKTCDCTRLFRFGMGEKVRVSLSDTVYIGEVISRLESHTGGIHYAVYADYKHGKEGYWFSERDIELAS